MHEILLFYLTDNNIDDIILTLDSVRKLLEETKSVVDIATTSLVLYCSNNGKFTIDQRE